VWWNGLKRLFDQGAVSVLRKLFHAPQFVTDDFVSYERTTGMVRLRDVLDNYQDELERLLGRANPLGREDSRVARGHSSRGKDR
jgi:hypothetical protein